MGLNLQKDSSYSPEVIHVCVENTHSFAFHTRAVHLCSGHCCSANCNRSTTSDQMDSGEPFHSWNTLPKSFFHNIPTAHHGNCTAVALFHIRQATWRHHHAWQHEILEETKQQSILISIQTYCIKPLSTQTEENKQKKHTCTSDQLLNHRRPCFKCWKEGRVAPKHIHWNILQCTAETICRKDGAYSAPLIPQPASHLWGTVVSQAQRTVGFCEERRASQRLPYGHKPSPRSVPPCWGPAQTTHLHSVKGRLQICLL